MNLAFIWKVPVLFVVENNGIAQTTPTCETIGGGLEARGTAFGLQTWRLNDASPTFFPDTEEVVNLVRINGTPGFLIIDTERLGPYSKGDDLRSVEMMTVIRERDPLVRLGDRIPAARRAEIDAAMADFLREETQWAEGQPDALQPLGEPAVPEVSNPVIDSDSHPLRTPGNVSASLNAALDSLLMELPECLIPGEDLNDPYGGAFKVTAGLSTRYPGPISATCASRRYSTAVRSPVSKRR